MASVEALLAAWRARPSVKLAAAIDAAGPPVVIDGKTLAEKTKRIRALSRDPRAATALLAIVRDVPFTSDGSRPAWTAVFEALERVDDPRVPPAVEEAQRSWKIRAGHREWLDRRVADLLDVYRTRWPDGPPAPSAADEKMLSTIEKPRASSKPRDEASLLAAIYAAPDDDTPRSVYADWLQERSDPRGEFIALQLEKTPSKASTARIKALLKQHERAWLGSIEPVMLKAAVVFRRGFVAECVARFKNGHDAEAYGTQPAWATVEKLCYSTPGTIPRGQEAFVRWLHPVMRALRDVDLEDGPLDALLGAPGPWAIERLALRGLNAAARMEAVAASDKLPKLVGLHVRGTPRGSLGILAGRLRDLYVGTSTNELAGWLDDASSMPLLEQFSLNGARFERDSAGRFSIVTIDVPGYAISVIDSLAETQLTAIKLNAPKLVPQARDRFAATAKKQVHLERLDLTNAGGELLAFSPKKKIAPAVRVAPVVDTRPALRRIDALVWTAADRLVGLDEGRVIVADPATGQWRSGGDFLGAKLLAASGALAAVAVGVKIVVRDLERKRDETTLEGHTDHVTSMTFSTDGKRLASVGQDKTLRVWTLADGRCEATIKTSIVAHGVAFLDEERVVATGGPQGKLLIAEPGGKPRTLPVERQHYVAAFADGRLVSMGWGPANVRLFAADGAELPPLKIENPRSLGVAGERIWCRAMEELLVWSASGGAPIARIPVEGLGPTAAWGDEIAIGTRNRIEIWSLTSAKKPSRVIA